MSGAYNRLREELRSQTEKRQAREAWRADDRDETPWPPWWLRALAVGGLVVGFGLAGLSWALFLASIVAVGDPPEALGSSLAVMGWAFQNGLVGLQVALLAGILYVLVSGASTGGTKPNRRTSSQQSSPTASTRAGVQPTGPPAGDRLR